MNDSAPNQPSPAPVASHPVGLDDIAQVDPPHRESVDASENVTELIADLEAADPAAAPELADRIARLLSERLDSGGEPTDAGAGGPSAAGSSTPSGESPA